jgi:hypothetical protein
VAVLLLAWALGRAPRSAHAQEHAPETTRSRAGLAGAEEARGHPAADEDAVVDLYAPDLATHPAPRGVPAATVRLPARGGAPRAVVVLLHGWSCCAPAMVRRGAGPAGLVRCGDRRVPGWGLGEVVAEAAPEVALVVPQLAVLARDGRPGRFAEPGVPGRWVEEAVARAAAARRATPPAEDAPLVLAAHSAGYETLLAWLRDPRVARRTRAVVLLDALYAGAAPLVEWAAGAPERRLVSVHTVGGRTERETARLLSIARRRLGETAVATQMTPGARVVALPTRAPHGAVPERHLGGLLQALDLAAR